MPLLCLNYVLWLFFYASQVDNLRFVCFFFGSGVGLHSAINDAERKKDSCFVYTKENAQGRYRNGWVAQLPSVFYIKAKHISGLPPGSCPCPYQLVSGVNPLSYATRSQRQSTIPQLPKIRGMNIQLEHPTQTYRGITLEMGVALYERARGFPTWALIFHSESFSADDVWIYRIVNNSENWLPAFNALCRI